jgi:hypothetical protein
MEETEIDAPRFCQDCVFQEVLGAIFTCKFYAKYKKLLFPMDQSPLTKPDFCRIRKIVVYEESREATWGGPDIRD